MSPDDIPAKLIAQSDDVYGRENFYQGCVFSPDGLCVLTSTATDAKLRIYNTAQSNTEKWKTALISDGGDTVRAYTWYPGMKSSDPATCCFLATCRDQPIHLYDAYNGRVRATYCPFNALDEMESPTVLTFTPDGRRILAGGFRTNRVVHVFDISRPGRESTQMHLGKTRRSSDGQKGLVSSISCSTDERMFAIGTYSPGSIYIYDDRSSHIPSGTVVSGACVVGHGRNSPLKKRGIAPVEGTNEDWLSHAKQTWFHSRVQGGIVQLQWTSDYFLYSSSRRSDAIILWDLRMLTGNEEFRSKQLRALTSFETDNNTNQRIQFHVHDKYLYVGGKDKRVRIYDTSSGELRETIAGFDDVTNGISCTNHGGKTLLAVATGSRSFPTENDIENDRLVVDSTTCGHLYLYEVANSYQ